MFTLRFITGLVLLLFTGVFTVSSQTMQSLDNATQSYNSGDFANAIQFFELTVSGGIYNGEIFYNLGNAYQQQGDFGKALLNYRRALQFIPRDIDLNIQIARIRTLRTILQNDTSHWLIFLEQISESVITIGELSIVTFILWCLAWIMLAFYRLKNTWQSLLRLPLAIMVFVVLCLCILLGARLYIYHNMSPAVVTVDSTPVYSGPSVSYFRQYDLYSAAEIYLIEQQDEWTKFVTPNNQQGWIQQSAVTLVPIE